MRISTSAGSNISKSIADYYGIYVGPAQIVVDGSYHDIRDEPTFDQIDTWVNTAKTHPYALGVSAAEVTKMFAELAKTDREILAVMTSKKVMPSWQAATTAASNLTSHPGMENVRVRVVDSCITDAGAGLLTMLAGEAAHAGLDLDQNADLLEVAARELVLVLYVATLDNLVKGGRASFLRAWLADVLKVRPLMTFVDGELKLIDKVDSRKDPAPTMIDALVERVGEKRPVWCATCHGAARLAARTLAGGVRTHFQVEYMAVMPWAASIYLHTGPGSVGAFVLPLDKLPWRPTKTPPPA